MLLPECQGGKPGKLNAALLAKFGNLSTSSSSPPPKQKRRQVSSRTAGATKATNPWGGVPLRSTGAKKTAKPKQQTASAFSETRTVTRKPKSPKSWGTKKSQAKQETSGGFWSGVQLRGGRHHTPAADADIKKLRQGLSAKTGFANANLNTPSIARGGNGDNRRFGGNDRFQSGNLKDPLANYPSLKKLKLGDHVPNWGRLDRSKNGASAIAKINMRWIDLGGHDLDEWELIKPAMVKKLFG